MCSPGGANGITVPLGLMKLTGNRDIQTLPLISGSISNSTQPTFFSVENSWYL